MPVIMSSPKHLGNPLFLSLPSTHPFPPLETPLLCLCNLWSIHLFLESLNFLVSREPVSSLRTLSSVRSCQAIKVFLPPPSDHATCSKCPFPFMAASYLFPLIFPKKLKLEISCCSHLLIPIRDSFFFVDFCSWLIIMLSDTTPALICDDSSIRRHDFSQYMVLSSVNSSLPRVFSSTLPPCHNFFICWTVCVLLYHHYLLYF